MKIKTIIFDYDGVIVDSFPNIHAVYQIICKKLGKKCPAKFEDFKKVYGYNSREFLKNSGFEGEEIIKFDGLFKEEIIKQEPKFFNNIDNIIKKLGKKYRLILVTSNSQQEVDSKLKMLGVHEHFDIVLGGKTLGPLKKTGVFEEIVKHLKLKKEEILVIGDRLNDYHNAKDAGLNNVILVEYGYGYEKSKIPDHEQSIIVKKPLDLIKAVKSFENKGKPLINP
jgi:phosphoglycolate phosphatase